MATKVNHKRIKALFVVDSCALIFYVYSQVWNVHKGELEWDLNNKNVAVLCCDFSPDSTKLLTGDLEGSVKVCFPYSLYMVFVCVCGDQALYLMFLVPDLVTYG